MIAHDSTSRAIPAALLLWALFQVSAPLPPPTGPQGFTISREVNLVVLPVTVSNRQGEFVSGLDAPNFHVYENGNLQSITIFQSEDVPVTVGLVVDRSGSMAARSNDVLAGAMAFLEVSNPQDREFVVNFTENIRFGLPVHVSFTSDANDLKHALSTSPAGGKTALYDSVIAALQHLDISTAGKKVLILISDGGDTASRHKFAEALRMAQSANATIYTIGLFDEHSSDQNPRVLRQLANETGGLTYSPSTSDDVVRVCRQIAGDIRHQYTIGYNPPDGDRSSYRKIHVEVSSTGHGKLTVRTRAGYFPVSGKPADSTAEQGASR